MQVGERDDLEATLADVRVAYRIVQQYQKRVADLATELALAIDGDLQFEYWVTSRSLARPRNEVNPAERWAWDGLPFYDYCTMFLRNDYRSDEHAPGDWMLVVRVSADDSFDIPGQLEPDPVDFPSAITSRSLVRAYVYQYIEARQESWIHQAFGNNNWPRDGEVTLLQPHLRATCVMESLGALSNADGVAAFASSVREAVYPSLGA